jgi:hypothetical protein
MRIKEATRVEEAIELLLTVAHFHDRLCMETRVVDSIPAPSPPQCSTHAYYACLHVVYIVLLVACRVLEAA